MIYIHSGLPVELVSESFPIASRANERSSDEVMPKVGLSYKMASCRIMIYASVAITIFILFLILNFAYLPKRKLSVESSLSRLKSTNGEKTTNVSPTNTRATGLKEEERELTLEDFKARQWNCSNTTVSTPHARSNRSRSVCYNEKDPLMCFIDPVHCTQKPTHYNRHTIQWPKYGEYVYLPKSKWKYIIVNGGVVFLYHPCASKELVEKLRGLARSCLHRHVITPYENLNPAQDFAIVAWGCLYSAKVLNATEGRHWIQSNAMRAPAAHITEGGDFNDGLKKHAPIVSDIHESELCPSELSLYDSSPKTVANDEKSQDQGSSNYPRWEERLSIKASERLVIVRGQDGKLRERHKFDSTNAAWAMGSLIFLCGLIISVMLYAKPCQQKDYWWRTDDITYNSNSKFSILKNRRMFWKGKNRRSTASSKLLGPIQEESDEEL